jgi:hypothetical protein
MELMNMYFQNLHLISNHILVLEETSNTYWLYHSVILRTGSYMFRQ